MSSKKLFLPVFLLLNFALGCASPAPVSFTPPEVETHIPNTIMTPISTPENIYDCYFTNLTPKEDNPCSVEQLEAVLGVDVKEPVIKDSQLDFVTAFWNGPSDPDKFNGAGLAFKCPDEECYLFFIQYPLSSFDYKGKIEWGKTPPSAIEKVELSEGPGEYVKGRFFQEKAGQPEIWSSDVETQMLVWVTDDVLFSITLNGNSPKEPLGKQDLIGIADSAK